MKAQMDLFDIANSQIQAEGADDSVVQTAFGDAEKAGAEVHKARGEADGCAGELEMYKQESDVQVERPELPDPTDTGGFDGGEHPPDIDVPGFATPFK
jgi:hypothetical protein